MTHHLTTGDTEGGVGLVRVWDTRPDRSQSLVWEFSPFRSSERIVLARFVSGENIVVVDRAGSVSLHSPPRRKMIAKTRLKLEHAGADLSPSGKSLYVAGSASDDALPLFV